MLHIVLYQPEIPPNTGNIIRLCANTGMQLHLIRPLGFRLEDKQLRRAGLDYHEWATLHVHEDFSAFLAAVTPTRCFALSTKGSEPYHRVQYQPGDAILFGPESRGLPDAIRQHPCIQGCIRIPMRPDNRSLNLSNAAAVVAYEAWRQQGFDGAV